MPAAFTVTLDAGAAFPLEDTSKLVSGWTPAPAFTHTPGPTPTLTPAPTSAAAVPTPSGAVIPSADAALAVLLSEIFHHRLQLVCLWFIFPEMSEVSKTCHKRLQ